MSPRPAFCVPLLATKGRVNYLLGWYTFQLNFGILFNRYIHRRTKKELNKMIDWDPNAYCNSRGINCRFPESIADIYSTNESERDKEIATEISELLQNLKGINYLQKLTFPDYCKQQEDRIQYLKQRFLSAPALAAFEVRSSLRSSNCALYEYLYGTETANTYYKIKSSKPISGNIISRIKKQKKELPVCKFPIEWLELQNRWILDEASYQDACETELNIYQKIGKLVIQLSGNREEAKVNLLIKQAKKYGKILAFDSTVITLDYFKELLEKQKSQIKILIATGQNERKKKEVREALSNDNVGNEESLIALCSDAMAESINLPGAKAMILLDMPSVLRIIEQRIGRLERMDSEHKDIYIFWPDDAEEFSLKGDKRMIDILVTTDNLIGNNVLIPQKGIYDKYYKDSFSTTGMIAAYKNYAEEEGEWEGVRDTTQFLLNLIGDNGLIKREQYDYLKEVDTTVKTAISFIETDASWSFFAFRGDSKRSPRWLLIDEIGKATTDFALICDRLTEYLKNKKVIQRKWSEVNTRDEIQILIRKLRKHERQLLPPKKQRALHIGESLLKEYLTKSPIKELETKRLIKNILSLFNFEVQEDRVVDLNHFAELWLQIFLPALDIKRNNIKRNSKIITLRDLKLKDINLDGEKLKYLYENCQYSNSLDELIASCIIAVKS